MNQLPIADNAARLLCRRLYEDTDGRPMQWRRPVSEFSLQEAVEYGVDHGWLLFDAHNSSICLTDEGRRQVRKRLS
jgi:hypothetical protein